MGDLEEIATEDTGLGLRGKIAVATAIVATVVGSALMTGNDSANVPQEKPKKVIYDDKGEVLSYVPEQTDYNGVLSNGDISEIIPEYSCRSDDEDIEYLLDSICAAPLEMPKKDFIALAAPAMPDYVPNKELSRRHG